MADCKTLSYLVNSHHRHHVSRNFTNATIYDTAFRHWNRQETPYAPRLSRKCSFLAAIFLSFCLLSCVFITQIRVWYQKNGFFMLYNNGDALLCGNVQSRCRKLQKRMSMAAILEIGGHRHSATSSKLTPSKIIIYTSMRLQRHITL